MDQDTKQAAAELLTANRKAIDAHHDEGQRLLRTRVNLISASRKAGMEWDEIASIVGHPDGHAMRMWYRRSGGDA